MFKAEVVRGTPPQEARARALARSYFGAKQRLRRAMLALERAQREVEDATQEVEYTRQFIDKSVMNGTMDIDHEW